MSHETASLRSEIATLRSQVSALQQQVSVRMQILHEAVDKLRDAREKIIKMAEEIKDLKAKAQAGQDAVVALRQADRDLLALIRNHHPEPTP